MPNPNLHAIPKTGLGVQILADLFDCTADINSVDAVRKAALAAARLGKVTVVREVTHHFAPHGVSCVLVLAESHMALHTWPEHGYIAVDLFTCDQQIEGETIIRNLADTFGSEHFTSETKPRGLPTDVSEPSRLPDLMTSDD